MGSKLYTCQTKFPVLVESFEKLQFYFREKYDFSFENFSDFVKLFGWVDKWNQWNVGSGCFLLEI